MSKFINPFTDIGFKRIFGDDNVRAYRDTNIVMEGQYLQGEQKGRAEGRAEERIANARSLKENGVPIDVIAKSLSLTDEELAQL